MKKYGCRCVMLLYVCMGILGILLSITNAFELEYQRTEVFLIVLLICGGAALFFQMKKRYGKPAGWIILTGSVLCLFLTQGETLAQSFLSVKKNVLETLENYLETYLGSVLRTTVSADLAMIVSGICIGGIFSYGVVCMRHAWLSVTLVILGFLVPFMVGKTPRAAETFLCLLVIPGVVSSKANGKQSGGVAVLLAVAALGIGSLFSGTEVKQFFQEQRENTGRWASVLKENSGEFLGKAEGGVSAGEVGGAGAFSQNDTKQLLLTVKKKPQEKMYLQGYIGNVYEDNRWKAEGETEFRKWLRSQNTKGRSVRNLLYQQLKDTFTQETVHIENIGANKVYKYIPYGGYYEEKDSIVADAYVKEEGKAYDVRYCPFSVSDLKRVKKTKSDLENAYFQYVSKQNTEVPKTIEKTFQTEIKTKIRARDVWGIMREVASTLKEQADYSLEPGRTPRGKDVAEYFYFENKKGYCEHFATVATLMLRMKGIPARYVAGYAVDPSAFTQKEDGTYEAVVTGTSAHAWAEAYVEGIGWIPVETTPGYGDGIVSDEKEEAETTGYPSKVTEKEESMQDEQEQNHLQQEEPQQKVNAEKEKETPRTDAEEDVNHTKKRFSVAVWIVPTVFFAVIIVFFLRRLYLLNERKGRRGKGYNGAVRELFISIFDLFVFAGKWKREAEADEEQMMKICECYPSISKETVEKMMEIVYRASFGKGQITKEEYQVCLKLYRQVKREVSQEISPWKKIWWKYWNGISLR